MSIHQYLPLLAEARQPREPSLPATQTISGVCRVLQRFPNAKREFTLLVDHQGPAGHCGGSTDTYWPMPPLWFVLSYLFIYCLFYSHVCPHVLIYLVTCIICLIIAEVKFILQYVIWITGYDPYTKINGTYHDITTLKLIYCLRIFFDGTYKAWIFWRIWWVCIRRIYNLYEQYAETQARSRS